MTFPRVLIYGQPFNNTSGGGITLSNLFKGWDRDKIAVACTGHLLIGFETDICNTYYQLGSKEHKWKFPFNKFQRKINSGILKENITQKQSFTEKVNVRTRFVDYVFYPFLKYWGLTHKISSIEFSPEFRQWLKEFKPEVLYLQVSSRADILFAQQIHSFLNIPMIVHNMDDWPSTISTNGPLKNYWHKNIDQAFRQLIRGASLLMGISDDMAVEYKKRYGKEFITFHNPIDIEFWKKYQRNNYNLSKNPSILYAGRIGIGVETSLELIAKAIEQLNIELSLSMNFVLQTQEKLPWFDKYDCVVHRPYVSYSDLPQKFSEADLLVLPYDFSQQSIKFIKLSMPTKAPEYMISGSPILILAPAITAIVRHAKKNNWALVLTEKKVSEIKKSIKSLIQNEALRQTIATNAKRMAEANYDSNIVNFKFRTMICSLNEKHNLTKTV